MKKTYLKPTQRIVVLQQRSHILTGSVTRLSGNANLIYGGAGDEDARAREDYDWDE